MPVKLPIYFDNHATTPCDPRVVEAMLPYFTERFGNAASRTHVFGFEAKAATELGRERVAELIGASPKEIVFTSGATEANNLAILGAARAARDRGRHVVTTAIEHKAVLDPCRQLEREGFEVSRCAVGPGGVVDADAVIAAMRPDTVLVSVMLANNEIGTLQPVGAIGRACRERGVLLHTDAAQAVGRIPVDVGALEVDLLSLTAHKLYGPKGIGALYVRRGRPRVRIEPLQHGGGHERGLRSGTLPVPLIVGLGQAAVLAGEEIEGGGAEALRALRDRLWDGLSARIEGVRLNGALDARLPGNLNVAFERVEGEALLMSLRDVALSSGSACSSATLEPSHVLRAIGVPEVLAHASIRFGLGRFNTAEEVDLVVDLVADRVEALRAMSPLYEDGEGPPDIETVR